MGMRRISYDVMRLYGPGVDWNFQGFFVVKRRRISERGEVDKYLRAGRSEEFEVQTGVGREV